MDKQLKADILRIRREELGEAQHQLKVLRHRGLRTLVAMREKQIASLKRQIAELEV